MPKSQEHERLSEIKDDITGWRRWGPYVSDRAWATVREDYSADGDAWGYLPHDMARSKAYRWGEDGIAGICDRYQLMCFAPAFWNGKDPILKERLFGLSSPEGNHGEDVKEYYFHVDNTPTHSYMKYLYKYPQGEFPYGRLVEENRRRGTADFEFELLDTGIFDDDRYFDIFIEYAKASTEDICIKIEAFNRGPEEATLHILPHLWFRNTWGWGSRRGNEPTINLAKSDGSHILIETDDSTVQTLASIPVAYRVGRRYLYADAGGTPLFTDNETNQPRVHGPGRRSASKYVKDAFHRHIIDGEACVNPHHEGTKAAIQYVYNIPPGGSATLRLRLAIVPQEHAIAQVDEIIAKRKAEADEFYAAIHPPRATEEERSIQRQAFAGLLWTKQSYIFDVNRWFEGDDEHNPPPRSRRSIRNTHWGHLNSMRIMSVCDKWEYPWFAAWDLAFHCVPLSLIDPDFAKQQLWLLLFEQFQHPNGQIPAYEWEFSDLNPPVHAWAVWRVYKKDSVRSGTPDLDWLEKCFHKLLINFAWWINKVDNEGNSIFEGGFLGLDNITVVDRSMRATDGSVLEQADATGWMGMFCLNLMRIALELSTRNKVYESLATKFFQHYTLVAAAMKHMGNRDYSLWDEADGFFYDVLRYPDGRYHKFRVRSLVGLIPLFAVERVKESWLGDFKDFRGNLHWFLRNRKEQVANVVHTIDCGDDKTHALTILDQSQLQRITERLCQVSEFLSPHGIRSLSKAHEAHPFEYAGNVVGYEPAESLCKIKGGNSNWRGPIWFPTSFLLIESLRQLGKAFGTTFTAHDGPDGAAITFDQMAGEIAERMINIFKRDKDGRRPVYGGAKKFQEDPHWRDHILFYEYFHGDNGAGLGASHQTGWTALVASLIDEWRE